MKRQLVTSSNISSIGYDTASSALEVEFKGGAIYQYYNVPENLYSGLINASSIGNYMNTKIKNTHRYKQIK